MRLYLEFFRCFLYHWENIYCAPFRKNGGQKVKKNESAVISINARQKNKRYTQKVIGCVQLNIFFFEPHRTRIVEVMAKLRFSVRVATAYPTDKNWGARGPHNVRRDISKVTEPIIFKLKYVLDGHWGKNPP